MISVILPEHALRRNRASQFQVREGNMESHLKNGKEGRCRGDGGLHHPRPERQTLRQPAAARRPVQRSITIL